MDKQKSFTLIELLVVIVIIGILAGVIMISTSSSIQKANIAKVKVFEESIQNNLAANMISRWPLDEGSGLIAKDIWGSNDGTLHNSPTWKSDNDCVSNGCLSFNGTNNYVQIQDDDSLDIINEISISIWIKQNKGDDSSGIRMLLEKAPSGTNGYNILLSSGGVQGRLYPLSIISAEYINDNSWHHIVMTNKLGINNWRLYADGKMIKSQNGVDMIANDQLLYIGSRGAASSLLYKGLIDDIRIYNAALSSAQIKQNYIAGLNSMLANENISKQEYNERINALAYDN